MHRTFLALLAICFSLSAADKTYVLKAAHMFDGKSDHVVSPGLSVVTNGKITAIVAKAAFLASDETIDLGDATLLPGLIDAHTHLTYPYERDYRNEELNALKKNIPERTLDAVDIVRRTLMAGFTTVRDVGAGDYIDVGLRNAIAAGKIPGPRMLVAVNALGATGGHCDSSAGFAPNIFGRETGINAGVINGPDQARQAVRYNIKYGADVMDRKSTRLNSSH